MDAWWYGRLSGARKVGCVAARCAALALMVSGCSGDDSAGGGSSSSATPCVPGEQIECACIGGTSGFQICVGDGSAYGPCEGCTGSGGGAQGGGGNGAGPQGGGGATSCAPGATEPCYSGPPGTAGVGICVEGSRTCAADGSSFGPCDGEVLPSIEVCATPWDDDCDGQVNEDGADCACAPGSQAPCYSGPASTEGVGVCHGGTQQCNASGTGYGPCVGEVVPGVETCATPDDEDCDGQVNEDGAQCVCPPSSTTACYGGPPGTENVGACKGGSKTCNALGTAYGACFGEVLPSTDFCSTPADDDCDGSPMPCVDNPVWSRSWGAPSVYTQVQRAVPDAAGNVVVLLSANAFPYGSVVKLDTDGNTLWQKDLGTATGTNVAVAPGGEIFVFGSYSSLVDLGGGFFPVPQNGDSDFVLALDAAGNHLWSRNPGQGGSAVHYGDVVVDPSGNFLVAGLLAGCADFGAGNACSGVTFAVFLLRFDLAGAVVDLKTFPVDGGSVTGVDCDALGDIAIGGDFVGNLDLGGGPISTNGMLAAVLDPSGAPMFAKTFGVSNGRVQPVFDGFGGLLLAGDNQGGVVDLGGGPLTPAQPMSGNDLWVGKLDATTGAHLWSAGFGNGLYQQYGWTATNGAGRLLTTGMFTGLASIGGTFLQSYGGSDVLLATYEPDGSGAGAEHFGDVQTDQLGTTVAVDAQGARILGGYFAGTIDLGSGLMTAQGWHDAFLAKLPP